jgi:hypothetical protein
MYVLALLSIHPHLPFPYFGLLHLALVIFTKDLNVSEPQAALVAGAKKEIAHLKRFGRPLHPFQRRRREAYKYQKQSPSEYLDTLDKYLQVAPFLIPNGNDTLARPTLRHPDLQPDNVFISNDLNITGLIDWQHCAMLLLLLQCGIPRTLQDYRRSVSESLAHP